MPRQPCHETRQSIKERIIIKTTNTKIKRIKITLLASLFLTMLCLFFIGWWRLGIVRVAEENEGYNYILFVKDRPSFKFFFIHTEGEENLRRHSDESLRNNIEYCENDSSSWRCDDAYEKERARRELLLNQPIKK